MQKNALCGRYARGSNRYVTQTLLVMKLTMFLLTAAFLDVSASSMSQNVTFSVKNVSLTTVFTEIEKQTGYAVTYTDNMLIGIKPVTIQAKNIALQEFLDKLLANQPLTYKIDYKTILISSKTTSPLSSLLTENLPPIKYTIKVVDSIGNPIIGATITLKSMALGVTNTEGFFVFQAAEGSSVAVSCVGFVPFTFKLEKNTNPTIQLILETRKLEEFVMTAYGQEKKEREIGYAVTKLQSEVVNQAHPVNFLNGLSGKVPGLNITSTQTGVNPKIRILLRGVRSLREGLGMENSPLFVMDGTVLTIGGSNTDRINTSIMDLINSINPVDIDNITVLQGANATTLYGSEGVNGVIIINTKKGSAGKTEIGFSQSTSLQIVSPSVSSKMQKEFGPGYLVDQSGTPVYDPYGAYGYFWGPKFNGQEVVIGRPDEEGNVQKVPYRYTNERFKFFNKAVTTQNDLSLSGGDSRSHFYLALQYTNIEGIIPGDKQKRVGFRANVDRTYGKLKASVSLGSTRSDINVTTGDILQIVTNTPAHIPLTQYKDFKNNKWADHNHYYNDVTPNPYEEAATKRSRSSNYVVFGNLTLTADLFPWLYITNRLGINYNNSYEKRTQEAIFYSAFAKSNGRNISYSDRPANVYDNMNAASSFNNDLLITGHKMLSDFSLKLMVGSTVRESFSKTLSAGAYSLSDPNVFNLSVANGLDIPSENSYTTRFFSLFSNFSVGYNNWAFLELTTRNDQQSLLNNGKNEQFYYGANASVVLSDAISALTARKVISSLRLRAALNKTANFNAYTYAGERTFIPAYGFPIGNLNSYTSANGFISRDLGPEKIISQEYGGEITFLKNRIGLDVSYYSQLNNGLILGIPISTSSGYDNTTLNAGKFRNKGWDFNLNLNPLVKIGKDIAVNISGRFSINDNKVISLYKDQKQLRALDGVAIVGNTAALLQVTDWNRDSLGRVIVDAVTGFPSIDPVPKIKGRSLPEYIAGVSLNVSWKGIALNVTAEHRSGTYMIGSGDYQGIGVLSTINDRQPFVFPNSVYMDGTGKYVENTSIKVSDAGFNFLGNTYAAVLSNYYSTASWWKIREAALSYELPLKQLLKSDKQFIKRISLSLYARNLFTFLPADNHIGDPEAGVFGSRFFGFNVNAGF